MLQGEVYELDGRVAASIPPVGMKGAIPFQVTKQYPASGDYPAWTDLQIAGKPCRMNSDIIQPPYFRFADCVACVGENRGSIPFGSVNLGARKFADEQFAFWRVSLSGVDVVMVDTVQRLRNWPHNICFF